MAVQMTVMQKRVVEYVIVQIQFALAQMVLVGKIVDNPNVQVIHATHTASAFPVVTRAVFPFDYCECEVGFTGTDCGSMVNDLGTAPWGNILGKDQKEYNGQDDYEDDHPVFNMSVLARIHVTMSDDDYLYCLQPWNLYNQTYVHATVHFNNGDVQETVSDVGVRIKGGGSRLSQKKGWAISMDEFVDKQRLTNLKKIELKPSTDGPDSMIIAQLYADFARGLGSPVQRSSYALLYINDVFNGIYFMHEDIGKDFLTSRFDDDGNGNYMKYFWSVHLLYYGPDEQYYKEKAAVNALGVPMYHYEQNRGDGDWSDFMELITFLNVSSDKDFEKDIEKYVDVSSLISSMIVDSFMLSHDNLGDGNNFGSYHHTNKDFDKMWTIVVFDFDSAFVFDSVTGKPKENPDIIQFYTEAQGNDYNILMDRVLNIQKYKDLYLRRYKTFLEFTFGSESNQQPVSRFNTLTQFLYPWVMMDKMRELSNGYPAEDFLPTAQETMEKINKRYEEVLMQLS